MHNECRRTQLILSIPNLKGMKKKVINVYESPSTQCIMVETESAICGGSVDIANPNSDLGRIARQKVNVDFSDNAFDESQGWELIKED